MDFISSVVGLLLISASLAVTYLYFKNRSAMIAAVAANVITVNPGFELGIAQWIHANQKVALGVLSGIVILGFTFMSGYSVILLVICLTIIGYGIYKSETAEGPILAAKLAGIVAFVLFALIILLGTNGTNELFKKIRTSSLEMVEGGGKTNSSYTQSQVIASPCGPNKFIDGTATAGTHFRVARKLACTMKLQKTPGVPAEIRYNNDAVWHLWTDVAGVERSKKFVKKFEVRPLNSGDEVYVMASFPRRR